MKVAVEDPRVTRSKEAIKSAALELLVEVGAEAITVERIAERSGVAKTTLYRHWPDKNALVLEVLESELKAPLDPDTGSLDSDLEALSIGLARGLADERIVSILSSLISAAGRDPGLAALHNDFRNRRRTVVEQVVSRGRLRGEIRSDITDQEVIDLVGGPLFYRRMLEGSKPGRAYARRIAGLVYELVSERSGSGR